MVFLSTAHLHVAGRCCNRADVYPDGTASAAHRKRGQLLPLRHHQSCSSGLANRVRTAVLEARAMQVSELRHGGSHLLPQRADSGHRPGRGRNQYWASHGVYGGFGVQSGTMTKIGVSLTCACIVFLVKIRTLKTYVRTLVCQRKYSKDRL